MSTTPPDAPVGPPGPDQEGPRVSGEAMRDLGRLRRTVYDRKIAGVAGGLARHFDVDPTIVRVALVVLAFFGGAGVIVYGACWLLVPEEGSDEAAVRLDHRNRSIALLLVAGFAVLALLGDSVGGFGFPWPLAVIAAIVWLVLHRRGSSRPDGVGTAPHGPGAPPPGTPGTGAHPATDIPYAGPAPDMWWSPPPPPSPQPHRRGPVLFGYTLALVAISLGVLGIVDAAGADVVASAYPALGLAIVGAMLVLGAFWGRAGGLIALGLVALVVTVGVTVVDQVDTGRIDARPATASQVQDDYELFAGKIELDLTHVRDLEELDGRTIRAQVVFGRIDVTLPAGLNADVASQIEGGGRTVLFGEARDGSQSFEFKTPGDPDTPTLRIHTTNVFGEASVAAAERSRP